MSYLEDAMKEAGVEQPETTTTTTTEETPKETPAEQAGTVTDPSTDDGGKGDSSSPAPSGEPQETSKEEPQKPKPDLSKLSKEEKAEHAFKRQLARQRDKYESQISKMMDQFGDLKKEFDEFRNQKPAEPRKTRIDFKTDDEYFDYLADLKVRGMMDAEKEKETKTRQEQEALQRQNEELSGNFRANCESTFQGEAYGEFATKVNKALENGLGEILDKAPTIRDFVFTHPDGPRVLNAMLTDKQTFVNIMSNAYDPNYARITLINTAAALRNPQPAPAHAPEPAPAPAPAPEQPKGMPHIGKPGARQGAGTAPLATDQDAINYIRRHR